MTLLAVLVSIISSMFAIFLIWLGWKLWHVRDMKIIFSEEGVKIQCVMGKIIVIL